MKISKAEIVSFIPQRAPFIMIDNLTAATAEQFETDFRILHDNIFVENKLLREFALIENIAQSSAAGLAFVNSNTRDKPPDGLLAGISKLKLYDLPKVNDTINTIVTLIAQFKNLYLLKGVNYVNGRKLLECELKLVGV